MSDFLQSSLDAARDPLLLVSGKDKVVWSNCAAQTLLGTPQELAAVIDPASMNQLREMKGIQSFPAKVNTVNGTAIPQMLVPLDVSSPDPDSDLLLVALFSQTSELERSTEKDRFLSTLVHDLKNPLGAIFGYADVLLDTNSAGEMNRQQRSVIAKMRRTAARTIDLVRNLQHLHQMQARAIGMLGARSNLNQSIYAVIESTWRESRAEPNLVVDLSPEPLWVEVDRVQLERVFANLFGNALKYTPRDATITVQSRVEDSYAVVSFTNSAPVIPQHELESLYTRYTRGSNAQHVTGSGLGLYIVKYILDRVGGSIKVESNKQLGTRFTVTLALSTKTN